MLLKRLYDHSGEKPKVSGVRVLRAPKNVQKFSPNLIAGGAEEGWLSMADGKITIKGKDGDVVFALVRTPGHYCCHCDEKIEDASTLLGDGRTIGLKHVADAHAGKKSPDPTNPSGYRKEDYYTAVNQTGAVDVLSKEDAAEMEKKIRGALLKKISAKYGRKN